MFRKKFIISLLTLAAFFFFACPYRQEGYRLGRIELSSVSIRGTAVLRQALSAPMTGR